MFSNYFYFSIIANWILFLFFLFVLFLAFRLPDGSLMEITKVYPLDAVFDNPDDVPEDV